MALDDKTILMDVYHNSPVPSNTTRQCSIRGCSRLVSNESTNETCESCQGRQDASNTTGVNNWMDDIQPFPSTSDPSPSATLPASNQSHPPTTRWPQSIDRHLFSTLAAHLAASPVPLSISDLENALLMPTTDQGIQPQLLPSQSDSASGSITSPVVGSNAEVIPTDESKEHHEDQLEPETSQMRICSVRACKQTVPVGYEYKMCPGCRVRYQKYGTTKRAKWKVEREKEKDKQKESTVTEDSEAPRAPIQPQSIEDATTPLTIPHPADKDPTPVGTTGVTEKDHTTPGQLPSAEEHIPSVQPQPLSQMHHQPPPYSTASHSSKVPFIQDQVRRPSSNPSAAVYLDSDPIVNGFSKFRVELFEGDLDGRYPEGTVMSAPHVMKLGEPSNTRADPPAPESSVSLRGKVEMSSTGEDHKDASGTESRETPGSNGNMTRPIVPVSLTVCHPVTSESEIQAAPCSPSHVQTDSQSQNTKDSQGTQQPPSTTPVPAPKTKGKKKTRAKAAATPTTGASTLLPPDTTASPPPHPGYPGPHPYVYPYYPMYFPPYPGAYQYPYFPMPFAPPPSTPSKTRRKKKPTQVADGPLPHPHPGSAYPYPPNHSGAWAYPASPLPPPPPPITPQGSASVSPVYPVPTPQPPAPPPASAVHAISAPFSLPALQQPSQSEGPSAPTHPNAHAYPHLSGTQPYSGTPLTTLMPVPFFPAAALSSASASGSTSRKDKTREAGSSKVGGGQYTRGGMGKEEYQINVEKQPHVQMQFNYYHYGMGTSQSPTTPENHARRKRRKVDPNYREKMEMFRSQTTVSPPVAAAAAANPDFASSSVSVPPQPDLNPTSSTDKQPARKNENLDEESSRPTSLSSSRRCLNKGCRNALPDKLDGNAICKKCTMKFKKRKERTKQRFRLVPKQTVCEALAIGK